SAAMASQLVTSTPFPPLFIVQPHYLGSWSVFLSLFNSLNIYRPIPQIIAIQDPPIWNSHFASFLLFNTFYPAILLENSPHKTSLFLPPILTGLLILVTPASTSPQFSP